MEGEVDNISLKKRALLLAMSTKGTSGVVDRLRVAPSTKMGDKEIKAHLADAITSEKTLAGLDINAEVDDGVVDLEGTVGSLSHKRLCGVFAWWVPGSRDVINSLEVSPAEEDSDDEITDAVRIALDKDKLVEASTIKVATKDWMVTLAGTVASEPEKQIAENDAWYVWGVNEVDNRLIVT